MSAHTKGPWTDQHPYSKGDWLTVRDEKTGERLWDFCDVTIGQGDKMIAHVRASRGNPNPGYPDVDNLEEMRANARIIANVPEMLHALQWIAENAPEGSAWRDVAIGAVAKATGQEGGAL